MAHLYKRPRSPFWWIYYKDEHDTIIRASTGFRIGIGIETQKARQMRDQRTVEESQRRGSSPDETWLGWVDEFFLQRYADSPTSLLRAQGAWRVLKMFIEEQHIERPRQLTRDHCFDYMKWRQKPNKSIRKFRAGHNTAQLELKFLGIIMDEAVERKYAPFNPCLRLHIKRLSVPKDKKKPAFTPELIELIRAKIQTEERNYISMEDKPCPLSNFLSTSFEIAYYHGCRISETWLNPQTDVEFFQRAMPNGTERAARITFSAKGRKQHTVHLHPKLFPLFDELRTARKRETYPRPKSPSKEWFNFLTRIGVKATLPKACFHSMRVTAATTFARKGIPKKKAMEYIGHASSTVHDSYIRLQPEDLDECAGAIQ